MKSEREMKVTRRDLPFLFGFGLLLLLALPPWRPELPTDSPDGSWHMVVDHALHNGWQWGTDLVFTAGPLSFLYTGSFDPRHWPLALLAWSALALAIAWAFAGITQRLGPGLRAATLFAAGLAISWVNAGNPIFLSLPLLVVVTLRVEGLRPRPLTFVLLLATAAASLAKMSALPLALATFALVDLGRLAKRRSPFALPSFAAAIVGLLLLAGQKLENLPAFLNAGLETITGYSAAMTLDGPAWEVSLAACLLLGLVAVESAALRYGQGGADSRADRWVRTAAFCLWAWMTWKSAFVRQGHHVLIAWASLALVAPLVAADAIGDGPSRFRRFGAWVAVALGVFGLLLIPKTFGRLANRDASVPEATRQLMTALVQTTSAMASILSAPGEQLRRLEAAAERGLENIRSNSPLPNLTGSVDALGSNQGAILAHGLTYRPRPSFQGYATYTPGLAARNRAFYLGPEAPEHVLTGKLRSIDQRLPALTEGPLWPILLARYRANLEAGGVLVLTQRDQPRDVVRLPWREFEVAPGEAIDLSSAPGVVWATIDVRPSLAGKLAALLYRLEPPTIKLVLARGKPARHRLIPGIASQGFLLSPLVANERQLAAFWSGSAEETTGEGGARGEGRVLSARVDFPEGQGWLHRDRIAVRLERLEFAADR